MSLRPLSPLSGLYSAGGLPPLNLVAEGDSTMAGTGASSTSSSAYLSSGTGSPGTEWFGLFVSLLRADGYTVTAFNNASGGSTMTDVNSRATTDDGHLSATPGVLNYIFLLEGYNDASTAAANQPAWFSARKTAGWRTVACLPFANIDNSTNRNAIKAAELANADSTVDFYSLTRLGTNGQFTYPWSADNVHPSDTGYAVLARKAVEDFRVNALGLTARTYVTHAWKPIGTSGDTVTVYGGGFTGATAVSFNGVAATSYTVNSDTSISAIVPATTSGPVSVTSPTGTGTSVMSFTYGAVSTWAPSISSLSPNHAKPGNVVDILGSRLSAIGIQAQGNTANVVVGTSHIAPYNFNNTPGAYVAGLTATDVPVVVPVPGSLGAVTLTITTDFGSTTATFTYDAVPTPTITSCPASAARNATIEVDGAGLWDPALSVTVGGVAVTGSNLNRADTYMFVTIPGTTPTGTQTLAITNSAGSTSTTLTIS